MSLLDDLKAKADASGDGKVSSEDLNALKEKYAGEGSVIEGLQQKADANGDGKLDLADLQDLGGNLGDTLTSLKDKFFK